ncbi:hypothetical protein V8E55_007124 [Tylopilus felleus]
MDVVALTLFFLSLSILSKIACCSFIMLSDHARSSCSPEAHRRSCRSRSSAMRNCSSASWRMVLRVARWSAVRRSRSSGPTMPLASSSLSFCLASETMERRPASMLALSACFHSSSGSRSGDGRTLEGGAELCIRVAIERRGT